MEFSIFFSWMFTFFLVLVLLAAILFLLLLSLIWYRQNNLIYLSTGPAGISLFSGIVPSVNAAGSSGSTPLALPRSVANNPPGFKSPAEYLLPCEDVYIRTSDNVRIHGWLIKYESGGVIESEKISKIPTLILFHGNAGNIGFRMNIYRALYGIVQCNILAVDYRGYGNSEGEPSETGLTNDAIAAVLWLHARDDIDKSLVFLYGQSLGGGVCIKTASLVGEKLAGIIVENTFTCIDDLVIDIAESHYKWHWFKYLKLLLACLITSRWTSFHYITKLKTPILFLSGLRDELIPPSHMRALYEASIQSKLRRIETFANGSHNDTHVRGGETYFKAIRTFIEDCKQFKN